MRKGIYHLVKQIVVLLYYLMCNLCPVKQNRIVFDSSLGKVIPEIQNTFTNISWQTDMI